MRLEANAGQFPARFAELLVSELGDGEDPQSGTAWKMLFHQLDTIAYPETKLELLIRTAAKLAG